MSNKDSGDAGEQEVIDLVPCSNCNKKLMKLPQGFPLVDVQCTNCVFRAQIKTNNHRPRAKIRGAGWNIMNGNIKTGQMVPPFH